MWIEYPGLFHLVHDDAECDQHDRCKEAVAERAQQRLMLTELAQPLTEPGGLAALLLRNAFAYPLEEPVPPGDPVRFFDVVEAFEHLRKTSGIQRAQVARCSGGVEQAFELEQAVERDECRVLCRA